MKKNVVDALKRASRDLLFPSESEYPFEPVVWKGKGEDLDPKALVREAGGKARTPVKEVDLDRFFRDVVLEKEWQDAEEKRDVARFRKLVATLKEHLRDIKVFRVGKIQVDVYIVGRTESGDWAGLKTTMVET